MEVDLDAGRGPVSHRCPGGLSAGGLKQFAAVRLGRALPRAPLAAAALLCVPLGAVAADVPADAPSDEQLVAALAAAERLMGMGRAEEALTLIRPMSEARPDSNQATFTTGLAALGAAELALRKGAKRSDPEVKENYTLSVRQFRRMLVENPSQLRVRLELGRALFSRGNCLRPPSNLIKHLLGDDCWAAEQHFLRVLGADVPPQVVLNIRRFIQICRARKRAQGSLSLAIAPDTNVNTATSAQTVNIFGLPFQLNDEARATSGIGVVGVLGGEIQRPIPKFKVFSWLPGSAARLRIGGSIFRRDYSGGEFDDSNYGVYAGPRFIGARGQMSILFQADQRAVNGRPYSRQYGFRVEGVRLVLPRTWAGGSFEGSRQTALSVEGPVGGPGFSWNAQSFATITVFPWLSVRLMGGAGRENTDRTATRHSSRWGGAMLTYDLPFGFTMTAAQQYFVTHFDLPNALFSPDPPKTNLWFSRLALHNRKLQIGGFSPSLSVIREDRASNLTIYQYQRYRVEGGVVRVF